MFQESGNMVKTLLGTQEQKENKARNTGKKLCFLYLREQGTHNSFREQGNTVANFVGNKGTWTPWVAFFVLVEIRSPLLVLKPHYLSFLVLFSNKQMYSITKIGIKRRRSGNLADCLIKLSYIFVLSVWSIFK